MTAALGWRVARRVMPLLGVVLGCGVLAGLAWAWAFGNTNFAGLAAPHFESWIVNTDYSRLTATDGRQWHITYEGGGARQTTFTGLVRHVSHWREANLPMLTHDILITTEEFAQPNRVQTWVFNHRFYYRFQYPTPQGRINLIHALPHNPDMYAQLLAVREGQQVTLRGYEILRITRYDAQGNRLGYWQDDGCNTTLVMQVSLAAPAP